MQREILASMRSGQEWTNSLVREEFAPIDSREALGVLQGLVNEGLTVSVGDRGSTTYRLAPDLFDAADRTVPEVEVISESLRADSQETDSQETTVADRKAVDTKQAPSIVDALQEGPGLGLSKKAIMAATGLTDAQVTHALRKMEGAGTVVVDGGRGIRGTRYRLPEGSSRVGTAD